MILITDGEPNACEDTYPSTLEAQRLSQQGINVYVVGFASEANESTLNAIAQAGGTDNPNDPTRTPYTRLTRALWPRVESPHAEEPA